MGTAPSKVKEMSFPSTVRKIYQMGEKIKKLVKITFTSIKVPTAIEKESTFKNRSFANMGYDKEIIRASANGKLVIDVPGKSKKAYKSFINTEISCNRKYTLK